MVYKDRRDKTVRWSASEGAKTESSVSLCKPRLYFFFHIGERKKNCWKKGEIKDSPCLSAGKTDEFRSLYLFTRYRHLVTQTQRSSPSFDNPSCRIVKTESKEKVKKGFYRPPTTMRDIKRNCSLVSTSPRLYILYFYIVSFLWIYICGQKKEKVIE